MKKIISSFIFGAVFLSLVLINKSDAASIPTISLNPTVGSSIVHITVMTADPNVSAMLYYQSGGSVKSTNIGTTDGNGYLSTSVDSSIYGITIGGQVYVKTNGQVSQTLSWPNYTSSGTLSLSQSTVTLSVGQNMVVTTSVSSGVSITNNTNSSVANVTLSGNQINISALNSGITTATVCATNIGCADIGITVAASGTAVPASIYLGQNSLSLTPGQNQTVTVSGSGNYYISSNSNPGIATANVSGSTLSITALSSIGSTSINLCSSSTVGGTVCTGLTVTVTQPLNNTSTAQSAPSFGQTEVSMGPNQNQTVPIYGTGNYSITNNSNPDSASASISTNNLIVYGNKSGGTNITVCQLSGGCSSIYVYVTSTLLNSSVSNTQTQPAVTSFSVSSSNTSGEFASRGSVLAITFSTNQAVGTPSVTVNKGYVNVSGSGSGPFTTSYTVTGNESKSIPVFISFNNSAGTGGQASFSIDGVSTSNDVSSVASSASSNSSTTSGSTSVKKASVFTANLAVGSKGTKVKALQTLLKKDGVYTGPINGTYGAATKAAVKKYQAKHKLSQTGSVGPATRALLNKEE
ncbi:MAG: peptidoglycan-binding domain-containing protein [bacterium]